jgi:hypothetical protein
MKVIILLLSLLNGIFMLLDGIYVLVKGKYIGPDKPGPWANIFYKLNVNVFGLGPLFISFGLLWLTFTFGLVTKLTWAHMLGILLSIATLWYLPFGTLISIVILALLITGKRKLGM